MYIYKLKFDNEEQATQAVDTATSGLNTWDYDVKVIGIHTRYEYDESDPEAEPIATVMDGWHVDIVSRVELVFDPVFLVEPRNPIHEFAGGA